MGKTNDLNLFLLFNRQKFPNPGFFFSLSSFRKFFPILLHREIETQIEILVSYFIMIFYAFKFFRERIEMQCYSQTDKIPIIIPVK